MLKLLENGNSVYRNVAEADKFHKKELHIYFYL